MIATNRRWPRFTLRTLLLAVTAACAFSGWLGWNLRAMHFRNQVAHEIDARGALVEWGWVFRDDLARVPISWRLLGAQPMHYVTLPAHQFTRREAEEIRRVFPEAYIVRDDHVVWQGLRNE